MKTLFSDRSVLLDAAKTNQSNLNDRNQAILQSKESLKRISKITKTNTGYANRILSTKFENVAPPKKKNDFSKDKNTKDKQNIGLQQKFQKISSKIDQKVFKTETNIQKSSEVNQNFLPGAQKFASQEIACRKNSESKPSKFLDKHMSAQKITTNQPSKQAYKKFDITKLDFSFAQNLTEQQISTQKLNKDKEYSSLVTKSRLNIKKIIELNRFLKQRQKQQNKFVSKTTEDRFMEDVEILDKIKVGCFGAVFRAKIKSNGKIIAIKSVPYDRKHHQREEEICKMVNNPFIVKIHNVYYTSDIEIEKKDTFNVKQTQKRLQTARSLKKEFSTNKSARKLLKTPTKNNIQLLTQNGYQQINLNQELKKNISNRGKPNKMDKHHNEYHRIINIAMELYDCDLHDYIMMKNKIDNLTLKLFCYQMLRSVLYIHSHQICHRDIKPNNFLVTKHLLVLTDFGSAKIMKNHKNSNVAYICSRYYRAPQLILGYKYYDKPIDIWSLGCVMAELFLGKPIFKGSNSLDQLVKIIRIIGQPNWRQISFMMDNIPKLPQIQSKGLKSIFPPHVSTLFIDLLESMLVINPLERITAGEALCHPFFDEIRDQMNFQEICKEMDISHFLKFNRDELKHNEHLKNKLIPIWVCQQERYEGFRTNNYLHS